MALAPKHTVNTSLCTKCFRSASCRVRLNNSANVTIVPSGIADSASVKFAAEDAQRIFCIISLLTLVRRTMRVQLCCFVTLLLLSIPTIMASSLSASCSLRTYPGYDGPLDVIGHLRIVENEDSLTIDGIIGGLEVAAAGGWHVHGGYSCNDHRNVGQHFLVGLEDLWTQTYWYSDDSGVASVDFRTTNFTLRDENPIAGRALVVHASDGSRIACGLIQPTNGVFVNMGTYPRFQGSPVFGLLTVTSHGDKIQIDGVLAGLEQDAHASLQVHNGYSCQDAAGVGEPYDAILFHGAPPRTTCESNQYGVALVDLSLPSLSLFGGSHPVEHRTVVAHLADDTRASCGIIGSSQLAAAHLSPYLQQPDESSLEGLLQVKGGMDFLKVEGLITGLEPLITGRLYVSTSYNCHDNANAAPLYFDDVAGDPWFGTTWESDETGTAIIDVPVESYSINDDHPVAGRAIIVDASTGWRVACALIQPTSGIFVEVSEFPGYRDNHVFGRLLITEVDDGLRLVGIVGGLEKGMVGDLRFHEGYTCQESAGVGGNYVASVAATSQAQVRSMAYETNAAGQALINLTVNSFSLRHGSYPVAYHTIVVYLSDNFTTAGCGLIGSSKTAAVRVMPNPNYAGEATVHGLLQVERDEASLIFTGLVSGLGISSVGRWYLSSSFRCGDETSLPLYDKGLDSDPWRSSMWVSDTAGNAVVDLAVERLSLNAEHSVSGRTIVFCSKDGVPVGCGFIQPTSGQFLAIADYPGVNDTEVSGTLLLTETDNGVNMNGVLAGLEKNVTGGLRVHEGYTCNEAVGVGEHYREGMAADPWERVTYASDEHGVASVDVAVENFSLTRQRSIQYRSTVAHKRDGSRAGCGIAGPLTTMLLVVGESGVPTTMPTPVPTALPTAAIQGKKKKKSSSSLSDGQIAGIVVAAVVIALCCVVGAMAVLCKNWKEPEPSLQTDDPVVSEFTSAEQSFMVNEKKENEMVNIQENPVSSTKLIADENQDSAEMMTVSIHDSLT